MTIRYHTNGTGGFLGLLGLHDVQIGRVPQGVVALVPRRRTRGPPVAPFHSGLRPFPLTPVPAYARSRLGHAFLRRNPQCSIPSDVRAFSPILPGLPPLLALLGPMEFPPETPRRTRSAHTVSARVRTLTRSSCGAGQAHWVGDGQRPGLLARREQARLQGSVKYSFKVVEFCCTGEYR